MFILFIYIRRELIHYSLFSYIDISDSQLRFRENSRIQKTFSNTRVNLKKMRPHASGTGLSEGYVFNKYNTNKIGRLRKTFFKTGITNK